MKVIIAPYNPSNPYQQRLGEELERLGLVVEPLVSSEVQHFPIRRLRRADVLHLHWLHPLLLATSRSKSILKSAIFLALIAIYRMIGGRIVWTAHNLLDHEHRFPKMQLFCTRLVARMASRVLVHSHAAGSVVAEALGIPRAKLRVVPHANYINEYPNHTDRDSARKALGISPDRFVFLFVGLIRNYKGLQQAIDSFRQLDSPDVQFLIAGRAKDDSQLRSWIADDPRIDYRPGFIADEKFQVYFHAADVVVLPFQDVLTSGSLLLGMSFGKPAILPDLPVLREAAPKNGALFYSTDDSSGLAGALQQAIQQRDRLAAMGRVCYDSVKNWGWLEMAQATKDVYQELLH